MLKSQKGYSLLISILCIVIFSVLGISLITLSANGIKKNESRDDIVQAETLATKGLDYIVEEINYKLELAVKEIKAKYDSLDKENKSKFNFEKAVADKYDSILKYYSCSNSIKEHESNIDSNNLYEYCVVLKNGANGAIDYNGPETGFSISSPENWYTINSNPAGIMKEVTLKGIGNTAEVTSKTLYSRKSIGITLTGSTGGTSTEGTSSDTPTKLEVPVFLQYAISTFEVTDPANYKSSYGANNNEQPKENGSVFFHGGVDIIGDMNIYNNLYVSQFGKPGYGNYTYSSYPRIMAYDSKLNFDSSLALRTPGTIYIGNKIYYWREQTLSNYTSYPSNLNTKHTAYLYTPTTNSAFLDIATDSSNNVKVLSKGIGISNSSDYIGTYNSETKTTSYVQKKSYNVDANNNPLTSAVNLDSIKEKVLIAVDGVSSCSGEYFINCNDSTKTYTSNLILKQEDHSSSDLALRKGVAYYKGNIAFGGSSCPSKGINIQGTFFVNGNLSIKNCTVNVDAVFYVNGSVDIESSNIQSLTTTSSLIVFAKDNIRLQKISAGNETPSNIKGYFITNRDIAITGSTSHIVINGGLSARSIELTAMRGPTTYSWDRTTVPKNSTDKYKNIYCSKNPLKNCNEEDVNYLYPKWLNNYNNISNSSLLDSYKKNLEIYKKQLEAYKSELSSVTAQLSRCSYFRPSTTCKNLQNQKTSLNNSIDQYQKLIEEENRKINALNNSSSMDYEAFMRSRLTVSYNPDVIYTYQEHALPELKYQIAPTTEKDRVIK